MSHKINITAIGSLAIIAVLLSACGFTQPNADYQPTAAPGYGYGPGMMNGSPGGMVNGGMSGMMGSGHMGGMASNGGMMGSYLPSAPTAEPTPIGATPVRVDAEIQITIRNSRFAPAEIAIKAGETVRFVVINNDRYLHNFVGEQAGIPLLNLPGNTTQTVVWTSPVQTGTYPAVCTLHPGMSLTIIIKD